MGLLTCSQGCPKMIAHRGLCSSCYQKVRRGKLPLSILAPYDPVKQRREYDHRFYRGRPQ